MFQNLYNFSVSIVLKQFIFRVCSQMLNGTVVCYFNIDCWANSSMKYASIVT